MTFEEAMKSAKNNMAIAMSNWTGETEKTTFVFLSGGFQGNVGNDFPLLKTMGIETMYVQSRLDKRLETGEVIFGWSPSQEEILSNSWEVIEV